MKSVQIHDCSCIERRKKEDNSLYWGYKLFLSKDRLEVVRVNCGIANISPFRIDILPSSESIWFGAKMTRAEPDDKVKLGEILGLLYLPLGQHFGSRKILKIFMIHNNVDGISWTFQIVSLNFESFKDGE